MTGTDDSTAGRGTVEGRLRTWLGRAGLGGRAAVLFARRLIDTGVVASAAHCVTAVQLAAVKRRLA